MQKRELIGKRIRFEVFKRDMFTCQYCGRKAPDVVLHVDHINPVAKGGKNEITNLVTSCIDCNSGKSDKKLSDNSVVVKQQKQLELIQERKEQLEMVFKWKESLDRIDEMALDQIIKQIELRMKPNTVNEKGRQGVRALVKKFSTEKILSAIDTSANKYIKFNNNDEITDKSAEDYFNKISGILYTETLDPLQKKIVYLKGIVRNRFGKDDSTAISIKINDYVKALRNQGYSDEKILKDLEVELIPKTVGLTWWSEWRDMIDKWTEDVNNWNNEITTEVESQDSTDKTLSIHNEFDLKEIETRIKIILHLGKQIPNFNQKACKKTILASMFELLEIIISEDDNIKAEFKNNGIDGFMASRNEFFESFVIDSKNEEFPLVEKSSLLIKGLLSEIFKIIAYDPGGLNHGSFMQILDYINTEAKLLEP